MVPIIIPFITTSSTFTFSGRFSTVGFSADDVTFAAVVVVAVVLKAVIVLLMKTDEDVGSGGRPVDIAAITFNMVTVNASMLAHRSRCGKRFLLGDRSLILDFVVFESP